MSKARCPFCLTEVNTIAHYCTCARCGREFRPKFRSEGERDHKFTGWGGDNEDGVATRTVSALLGNDAPDPSGGDRFGGSEGSDFSGGGHGGDFGGGGAGGDF